MNSSNNRVPDKFGFYAILTNPVLGFERLTEILVEEKIAFIQLRIKENNNNNIHDKDIISIAKEMRSISKDSDSKFIVNDNPFLAIDVNADGIHLGQNDLPYNFVRKLVGEKMIVGLSTHNPEQVKIANKLSPDYIGMGPVFKTPTKKIADPEIGISGLKQMMIYNQLPFVAIGGIDLVNLIDVLGVGAKNFSAVRLIDQCSTEKEVKEKIRVIKDALKVQHLK